jgi:N-acetylmuramoyl-L-alanine amidase
MIARAKLSWGLALGLGLSLGSGLAAPAHPLPAAETTPAADPDARPPQPGEIGWQRAVRLRTQLENLPPEQRTAERFQEAMDAFRQIYRTDPNIARAPEAVSAVADLMAERGRLLHEEGALRAALLQYGLLRKEYPRSDQARMALLLEAGICRDDLRDYACARQKLSAVIAAYPDTSFSEQADLELRELPPDREGRRPTFTEANDRTPAPLFAHPDATPVAPAPTAPTAPTTAPTALPRSTVRSQPAATQPAEQQPAPMDAQDPDAATDHGNASGPVRITGFRHWSNATSTRIAIDLTGKVTYEAGRVHNPDRIYFDLHGAHLIPGTRGQATEQIDDGYLARIRSAQFKPDVVRVVLDVSNLWEYSAFLLPNPWRLIIDIHGAAGSGVTGGGPAGKAQKAAPVQAPPAVPQTETAPQSQSQSQSQPGAGSSPTAHSQPASADQTMADLARLSSDPGRVAATNGPTSRPIVAEVPDKADAYQPSLVLPGVARRHGKHAAPPPRIVIDAGHGGHDSGTLGPGGMEEKDVVLDVALRTGRLLHKKLGAEILYTRSDDTFVPLETRTAIANKAQADLFLSVHANSSQESTARGVETYYLNPAANARAVNIAARENAVSDQSVVQLSELVRKTQLKERIEESRAFADAVDAHLYDALSKGNPGLKDRGSKRAPFVVLIGAQMPAVLAEISFLTNHDDARKLARAAYRQHIAAALDAGVEEYLKQRRVARPKGQFTNTGELALAAGTPHPPGK